MDFLHKDLVAQSMRRRFRDHPISDFPFDGCTAFTQLLNCRDCGACCRAREGTILVTDQDIDQWHHTGRQDLARLMVPGHFGELAMPMANNACVFQGTLLNPNDCSIYQDRASVCHSFQAGCPQCLDIRRHEQRARKALDLLPPLA